MATHFDIIVECSAEDEEWLRVYVGSRVCRLRADIYICTVCIYLFPLGDIQTAPRDEGEGRREVCEKVSLSLLNHPLRLIFKGRL